MNEPTCTCPSGDGSLDWPCPVHPVDPGTMEGAFHRAIKPFVDKTLQGRIMGAFRKVMQDRAKRLADAEIQITNPWKDAIVNAWCANGVRAMHEDPQKAVAELLKESGDLYMALHGIAQTVKQMQTIQQAAQTPVSPITATLHRAAMEELAHNKRTGVMAKVNNHVLFTDNDADRPDAICDRNGQVVLGLCKVCGKAESELAEACKSATQCRDDSRCQYAIDHGAEGLGSCPVGKCEQALGMPDVIDAALKKGGVYRTISDGKINEITMDNVGKWPSFEAQSWACQVVHAVMREIKKGNDA